MLNTRFSGDGVWDAKAQESPLEVFWIIPDKEILRISSNNGENWSTKKLKYCWIPQGVYVVLKFFMNVPDSDQFDVKRGKERWRR